MKHKIKRWGKYYKISAVFSLLLFFPFHLAISAPLSVHYLDSTAHELVHVWEKYESIPAGVTLEGEGNGIPLIRNIRYDAGTNSFILNHGLRYPSPVSESELREIAASLAREDKLGFSAERGGIIYGALPHNGLVAESLKKMDLHLGTRASAKKNRQATKEGTAIHFSFGEYRFAASAGRLRLEHSELQIRLFPIMRRTNRQGFFIPDIQALRNNKIEPEYEKNILTMIDDFHRNPADEAVKKVVRYGEVAAFLRTLKSNGENLNNVMQSLDSQLQAALLIARSA